MAKTKRSNNSSRSARSRRLVGFGVLMALLTGLGYAAFGRSKPKAFPPLPTPDNETQPRPLPASSPVPSGFPLRRGSKGSLVTQMQTALERISPGILSRYGADGDFGGKTEAALVKLGLPKVVDKATFDRLIARSSAVPSGGSTAAKALFQAIAGRNFPAGLSVLRSIDTAEQFAAIDRELRRLPGNPNAVDTARFLVGSSSPLSNSERQLVIAELLRIGLVHDARRGTWAVPFRLSGHSMVNL